MGAIGAIVLAVMHHKEFSRAGQIILYIGIVFALGLVPTPAFPNIVFRFFFAVMYAAIIVVCLEALRIGELRSLIKQAYETSPCASPPWSPSS